MSQLLIASPDSRRQLCVEMCDQLLARHRQAYFDSLRFDDPTEFDRGDIGVPGGLKVRGRRTRAWAHWWCWHWWCWHW